MYQFLAKQGQAGEVLRALKHKYGVKPRVSKYSGPRGEGFLIQMERPKGVSKRSIDRYLHFLGIPGAKSRKSKLKVIKIDYLWDTWIVRDKGIKDGEWFIAQYRGKFYKAKVQQTIFCDCCGPAFEIVLYKGGRQVSSY